MRHDVVADGGGHGPAVRQAPAIGGGRRAGRPIPAAWVPLQVKRGFTTPALGVIERAVCGLLGTGALAPGVVGARLGLTAPEHITSPP